jgi:hypothetical protein
MRNLTRKLAVRVAAAALYAVAAVAAPAAIAWLGGAAISFAKDGGDDGGDSGSGGDDGGNSGSGGGDDSGGEDGDSSGPGSGDDSGDDSDNSGRGSDDDHDDSGDDSSSGRSSGDRPEVEVTLTAEQLAGVQAGTLKLVDNLGRVLELEIETEHGVTTVSAKPHGGDSRRNPGPITAINIVPAGSAGGTAGDDDGTPDQGSGDN